MSYRLLALGVFLVAMVLPARALAGDDFQHWSQGLGKVTPKGSDLSVGIYGEIRMTDNATHVFGVFVGPLVHYRINEYLQTGTAWKLIVLGINGRYEKWQRVDFELNPGITELAGTNLSLKLRNRGELFVHPTDSDPLTESWSTTLRMRHRLRLAWSFDEAGPLEQIYADNEWFWGQYFRGDRVGFTEDRITPLGLQLRLSDMAKLNVYYLIQLTGSKTDGSWSVGHCLGTFLTYQAPQRRGPS